MYLNGWKGWSQDPPLPRSHLRVGRGGKGILLEIPTHLKPSEGKQILSFVFVPMAVGLEEIFTCCCSLGSCCSAVIAVLYVVLPFVCHDDFGLIFTQPYFSVV